MKQFFKQLFSSKYNEIVQHPETQSVTTTLIISGQVMGI